MANQVSINKSFNGSFEVIITHKITNGYELQYPIVEDGVKWETERQGSASKLTFKVYKDKNKNLNFQEGDGVTLKYKDSTKGQLALFSGYIFSKKRNKDGWIEVTAYDQLRYFKNKATYVYTNKKASDVLKMIANDYNLSLGTIDSTSYVIGSRVEDDQSLFDIIQNALDLTLISTNKLYVLYSDGGKLHLRDANNLKTNVVICDSVAEDLDYTSSIDDATYNEIELYYDNDETNKREYYNAVDATNVRNWGRLRYTESVDDTTNIKNRVKQMLQFYNQKTRKLTVKGAFGDCQCRAGASVIVQLDLGDITVSNYMLIEKATHTFKKDEYRMDLTLDGFKTDNSNQNVLYSESNVVETTVATPSTPSTPSTSSTYKLTVDAFAKNTQYGDIIVTYYNSYNKKVTETITKTGSYPFNVYENTLVQISVKPERELKEYFYAWAVSDDESEWKNTSEQHKRTYVNSSYSTTINRDITFQVMFQND